MMHHNVRHLSSSHAGAFIIQSHWMPIIKSFHSRCTWFSLSTYSKTCAIPPQTDSSERLMCSINTSFQTKNIMRWLFLWLQWSWCFFSNRPYSGLECAHQFDFSLHITGGVLYAQNPLDISTRRSKYTYGTPTNRSWKEGDPPSSKYTEDDTGDCMCRNTFCPLIYVNQAVEMDEEVSKLHMCQVIKQVWNVWN